MSLDGAYLSQWRVERGMSIKELAEAVGAAPHTVKGWEKGVKPREPHVGRLTALMAGRPVPGLRPPANVVGRETITRWRIVVTEESLRAALGLPAGAELSVVAGDGKTRWTFPFHVLAENKEVFDDAL